MRALDRSILMGRVGRSSLNSVTRTSKQSKNGGAVSKITPSIHADIFVSNSVGEAFGGQKTVEEVKRGGLGNKCLATERPAKVISNQNITCLAIEANVAVKPGLIGGTLNNETEIDG
jgi:hypothetical protein